MNGVELIFIHQSSDELCVHWRCHSKIQSNHQHQGQARQGTKSTLEMEGKMSLAQHFYGSMACVQRHISSLSPKISKISFTNYSFRILVFSKLIYPYTQGYQWAHWAFSANKKRVIIIIKIIYSICWKTVILCWF